MQESSAVFLDRDGTIIEDTGYINDPAQVIFYPESFEALKLLQEKFLLFIITNQSGIAKKLLTVEEVENVNNFIIQTLNSKGIEIRDIFCCPHNTEDNCICRKPNPYFINTAVQKYNINKSTSFIIGDHMSDVMCGINSGIIPIYVLTGHGKDHEKDISKDITVCENIKEASNYILNYK